MNRCHPNICKLWTGHQSYKHLRYAIKFNTAEKDLAMSLDQMATYIHRHGISMTRHDKNSNNYTQYPTFLHAESGIAHLVRTLDLAILVTDLIPDAHIPLTCDFELFDCSTDSYMRRQAAYSNFYLGLPMGTIWAKSTGHLAYLLKTYQLKHWPNLPCTGS